MIGKWERVRFRWVVFLIGLVMFGGSLSLMLLASDVENPPPFMDGPWVLLSVPLILGLAAMVLAVYEYLERKKGREHKTGSSWRIDWVNFFIGLAVIFLGILLLADYCQTYCSIPVTSPPVILTDLGLRIFVYMGGMFWFIMMGVKKVERK